MGVEQWGNSASTPSLMELLAIRLGYQKTIAKSLVIALPLQGGELARGPDVVPVTYDTVRLMDNLGLIITIIQLAEILQAITVMHIDVSRLQQVIQVAGRYHHLSDISRPGRDRDPWDHLGISRQH